MPAPLVCMYAVLLLEGNFCKVRARAFARTRPFREKYVFLFFYRTTTPLRVSIIEVAHAAPYSKEKLSQTQ